MSELLTAALEMIYLNAMFV